ncbi:tetratricopeptide repeat protein [Brumimicrobium aurantiacum]|uniref:Tetratricopeptide repeat protein n=1 Tax=Brumimicrobium aurantiacum TaxID=1737063 RepID=A0A3E1EVW8_9FLAO|nr:tetratricopeptide repeat protein [Brumimicrobium aurantiacum]RFC53687.1 tetratricopeptide repeat protein [Brumimicrobium aurantiacum]
MYINSEHKKAQALLDQQKFEKALIAFNKALKIDPNHPDILSHRGVLHLHMNQKKKCFDDLELSLRLDKNYSYRYAALAYAKDFFGDTDTAIELYEKAVQVDPEDSISHNNLGLLMEKKGYQQKAKDNFEKADKLAKIQDEMLDKLDELEQKEDQFHQENESKKTKSNPLPKPGEGLKPKGEPLQPKKLQPEVPKTFKQVSKDLITKKSVFKEFIGFVKNGFKLKQ